jgi:uncharacterized membrane protein
LSCNSQPGGAFSGPIPPPSILEKYNAIIPNGAERILAMAEKQSAHRARLESRVIDGNVASQTRGSYFTFVIVLVALLGGFYLLHEGKSLAGLSAIIVSVGGVVAVFFVQRQEQRKERVAKSAVPRGK